MLISPHENTDFAFKIHENADFPLQNASKRCVSPLRYFPFKIHEKADFPPQNASKRCVSPLKCIKMLISPHEFSGGKSLFGTFWSFSSKIVDFATYVFFYTLGKKCILGSKMDSPPWVPGGQIYVWGTIFGAPKCFRALLEVGASSGRFQMLAQMGHVM